MKTGYGKRSGSRWWMIFGIVCAVVVIAFAATFLLLNKSHADHYASAQEFENQGQYQQAHGEYLLAGDYMDAPERAEETRKAEHYRLGEEALKNSDFDKAMEEFAAAEDYADAEDRITAAKKMKAYHGGIALMEKGDYAGAIQKFREADGHSDSAAQIGQCHYALGLAAMEQQDYLTALGYFEDALDVADAWQCREQCAALYAKDKLTQKDYGEAVTYFQIARDCDPDNADYESYILLCQAEQSFAKGKLSEGMDYFDQIPTTFNPQEFSVPTRRNELRRYATFCAIEGTWNAGKYNINAVQSKNGWVTTYYYPEGKLTGQTATVTCKLNADGTVTVSGSAKFYYFNTFPGGMYTDKTMTVTWEIENLNYLPSTYSIDEHTKLYFTGGHVRVVYQNAIDNGTATTTSDLTYSEEA